MRKKPNNNLIGLFIVCGITLFLATVGMFVSEKIMADTKSEVVMYFSESIKGLDVGSPVVFKGVNIGRVSKIDLITDMDDSEFSIPVFVAFNRQNFNPSLPNETRRQILRQLVDKGLRARLNTQNYLTGQLMVELEMMPVDTPAVYRSKDGSIPEIPTVLSPLAELSRGFQEIPLKQTVTRMNKFLDSLNEQVVPKLNTVLEDFAQIPEQTKGIPETLRNIDRAVKEVPDALRSFDRAMTNISGAAKSLNNFADYIERHPEALLKGKGRY